MCLFVCVSVCDRERERDRKRRKKIEFVHIYMCMCVCMRGNERVREDMKKILVKKENAIKREGEQQKEKGRKNGYKKHAVTGEEQK